MPKDNTRPVTYVSIRSQLAAVEPNSSATIVFDGEVDAVTMVRHGDRRVEVLVADLEAGLVEVDEPVEEDPEDDSVQAS